MKTAHKCAPILVAAQLALLGCGGSSAGGSGGQHPHVLSVQAAQAHSCALLQDSVSCWGWNDRGQAGTYPGTFSAMSTGENATCALDGQNLRCFGEFVDPSQVPEQPLASLSVGQAHGCGLVDDGTLICWPLGLSSSLGGSLLAAPAGTFSVTSAGWASSCAIRTDGSLACWGQDVAIGSPPSGNDFVDVSVGADTACALQRSSGVRCWGAYEQTIVGDFSAVSTGRGWACALRNDGIVNCTALDSQLELAVPPESHITQLDLGSSHGCAVKSEGGITCWGSNQRGQTDVPAALR